MPPPRSFGWDWLDEEEAGPWLKNGHLALGQLIIAKPYPLQVGHLSSFPDFWYV